MTGSCPRHKNEQWTQSQHLEGKIRQGKIVHVGSEDRIDSECISQGVKLEDEKPSMNQRTTWPLTLKGPPDLSTSKEDVRSGSSPVGREVYPALDAGSPGGRAKRRQASHEVRGFFYGKNLDNQCSIVLYWLYESHLECASLNVGFASPFRKLIFEIFAATRQIAQRSFQTLKNGVSGS